MFEKVFVTGGAGYVGSSLVPRLLEKGHEVSVYDLFIYGDTLPEHPKLRKIKADIRDGERLRREVAGSDALIHLACISNDPSFDLDPALGRSINFEAFPNLVESSRDAGVKRFILASSTSQYGIVPRGVVVNEEVTANPQTDYAKFKLACEKLLTDTDLAGKMEYVLVRPSTLCGYAPRLRLDLVTNIFTKQAVQDKRIRVFNGDNFRAALHVEDMSRFYELMINAPSGLVNRQAFNVSDVSCPIRDLAVMVRDALTGNWAGEIELVEEVNDDNRSYPVDASKAKNVLGFQCKYGVADAARGIRDAYSDGRIKSFDNPLFYNIRRMKELNLK